MCTNILRTGVKRMGPDSSVVPSDRTRDNRHKLKHQNFHPSMRENFTVRVTKHWNRQPTKFVASPYLETFKTCLSMILYNLQ